MRATISGLIEAAYGYSLLVRLPFPQPLDPGFFPNGQDFRGLRVHQTRLQGGDASSDSYCHTR